MEYQELLESQELPEFQDVMDLTVFQEAEDQEDSEVKQFFSIEMYI